MARDLPFIERCFQLALGSRLEPRAFHLQHLSKATDHSVVCAVHAASLGESRAPKPSDNILMVKGSLPARSKEFFLKRETPS